jgi:hypothetical protein
MTLKKYDTLQITRAFMAALGLLIASPCVLWASPIGYSVQSNGNDHLYAIDLATGVASDLGLIGFGDAEGLSFDSAANLYAIGGNEGQFWNITTPPGFLIGSTGPRAGIDAGLDSDPTTGKMYNIQGAPGSSLYEINVTNGAATLIGSDTEFSDGMAINSSGQAFAADAVFSNSLYRVNLANGALTAVGPMGFSPNAQAGMSFDQDGTLYMLLSNGGIYTVNTGSGAATFVANVTFQGARLADFEGLAIPKVPEPAALSLAGIGAINVLMLRFRRRPAAN